MKVLGESKDLQVLLDIAVAFKEAIDALRHLRDAADKDAPRCEQSQARDALEALGESRED